MIVDSRVAEILIIANTHSASSGKTVAHHLERISHGLFDIEMITDNNVVMTRQSTLGMQDLTV